MFESIIKHLRDGVEFDERDFQMPVTLDRRPTWLSRESCET